MNCRHVDKILNCFVWAFDVRWLLWIQKVITSWLHLWVPFNQNIVLWLSQHNFQFPRLQSLEKVDWLSSTVNSRLNFPFHSTQVPNSKKSPAISIGIVSSIAWLAFLILRFSIQTSFSFLYRLPEKFIFFDLFFTFRLDLSHERASSRWETKSLRRDKSQRGQKTSTCVVSISIFESSIPARGHLIGSNATSTSAVNDSVTFWIKSRLLAFWRVVVEKRASGKADF